MKKKYFFLGSCLTLVILLVGAGTVHPARLETSAPKTIFLPLIQRSEPAFWLGPEGGIIVTLVADPLNPQHIYAGSWGGGVFKSENGGLSWAEASAGLGNLYINALAVDPRNPSILYAGTYKDKIYKSIDGAANWIVANNGIQAEAVTYAIAVDPQVSGVVYAGTRGISNNGVAPWAGVLYKSVDGGANWQPKLQNIGGSGQQDWIYSLAIAPGAPQTLYAASHEHGPFRSDNRGESWYAVPNGISDGSGRAIGVDPKSSGSGTVYMGVWHRSGVFKTINGGGSWVLQGEGLAGAKIFNLAIDPVQPANLYLATTNMGVMKTSNGGQNWQTTGGGLPMIYGLLVDAANPQRVFAGTAGKGLLLSTTGGGNWVNSQSGLKASVATALVIHPTDAQTIFTSLWGGGVMKSANRGESWSDFNYGLGDTFVSEVLMHPKNPNLMYALTNSGGLFRGDRSSSQGWQSIGSNLPMLSSVPALNKNHPFSLFDPQVELVSDARIATATTYAPLNTMVFAPSNPKVLYLGSLGSGLYRSQDEAASWSAAGFGGQSVVCIAIDPANPNQVWAASDVAGGFKVSSDGGVNWKDAGLPGLVVYALKRSPSGVLYAGTNDGVYRQNGTAWVSVGLKGIPVTALGFHPAKANIILAGGTDGAWVTNDSGAKWTRGPAALRYHTVQTIQFDWGEPAWVYFSTRGHGVFKAAFIW